MSKRKRTSKIDKWIQEGRGTGSGADYQPWLKIQTEKIRQLQLADHETIAVICKTGKESREAYDRLSEQIYIQLMEHSSNTYQKGILILPAYLAKGIEFDAVIIYDTSNVKYGREFERKLFYTACTRAMHELHFFYVGEISPFMNKIPVNLYEITE